MLVSFAFLQPVWADHAKKKVTLATRTPLLPYVNEGASGGIEVDLVTAILAKMGFEPSFVQLPVNRLQGVYDRKRVDGVLTRKSNEKASGCASDVYFEHPNVAFTLAEAGFKLTSIQQLENYSVLSFVGARRFLEEDFGNIVARSRHYAEVEFQETHIGLLYDRRFDVVVGDEWILRHGQKKHYQKTGVYKELAVHNIMTPLRYRIHFHDSVVCAQFNHALAAVRASGEYQAVLDAHHGNILDLQAADK